ncbi:MAG: efflux RND transporter periplasmic adaptor subunit [Planctomycetes bacterium]|nr:efflux RND transporter periplasmic adaptor subunit [Planctomycetota bacterium]
MTTASPSLPVRLAAVALLFVLLGGAGYGVYLWKLHKVDDAGAKAKAAQVEYPTFVEMAAAHPRSYARTTTSIGTARALQSISLRNELAGTVRKVALQPGQVVEAGVVLVELDITVEEAELKAIDAEARVAASMLVRMEKALAEQGASAADVDRARAEADKAIANVARLQAVIERKRVRAPFRATVGMVDLHIGQYLEPGSQITTLQGTAEAMHVDFAVTQEAASRIGIGTEVEVSFTGRDTKAKVVALDAQVDAATRNTWIRAELTGTPLPAPGSSVRVRTPLEGSHEVLVVPVSAVRRSAGGEHVFVVEQAADGTLRAHLRAVKAGSMLGDEIVVRDGLRAGERVIAAGSFKQMLRDGALVADAAAMPSQAAAGKEK